MQNETADTQTSPSNRTQLFVFGSLALVLIVAFFGYRQGLPGSFMFDDYPNLQTLSNYGGVDDLRTLNLYLDDQFAGPTGRPISMLSFLIDVRDWPADPGATKLKNVLIHLLNGLLLAWLITSSLRQSFLSERPREVLWIAALAAAWWILHPFHVSTVLYAIQRMAELATLFTFLGLGGYVAGRRMLQTRPRRGYAVMAASLGLGTVLAVLSKENGALLPLLALVLEGTILASGNRPAPHRLFRAIFLWLPAIAVVAYIVQSGLMASDAKAMLRGFTVYERLLTEARVIFIYLQNLIIPAPQTGGIFRDSLAVSTSLFSPLSTLFAVIGVIGLCAAGFALRTRLPLVSAAILFFIGGHIIESTAISLELYFEHRNYLPSALLFLPVAQVLVWAARSAPKPVIAGAVAITIVLTGTLWARADLWSDRTNLYLTWANENLGSPRAQLSAVNVLQQAGATNAAIARLEAATEASPQSLALQAHLVRMKANTGNLQASEIRQLLELARSTRFEGESIVALRRLSTDAFQGDFQDVSRQSVMKLWTNLKHNENYTASHAVRVMAAHELGKLHATMGDREEAVKNFDEALAESESVETGLMQAAVLATNRYFCAALDQLDDAKAFLATSSGMPRSRDYFASEIDRLRQLITREAQSADRQCPAQGAATEG